MEKMDLEIIFKKFKEFLIQLNKIYLIEDSNKEKYKEIEKYQDKITQNFYEF